VRPFPAGEADARVHIQTQLVLSFYCVGGPTLAVTGNLGFDGQASLEQIAWELYWSIVGSAGGEVAVLGRDLGEVDLDIYSWRNVIAEGAVSTEPSASSEPETLLSADFREATIAETDCTTQVHETSYNSYYGENWRMQSPGFSYIDVQFELDSVPTSASLWITHLSSANDSCSGGGYAPIDLWINDTLLLNDYDVAEHHDGTHGYVTDGWPIASYLEAGSSSIRIEYEDTACTHYWIQLLEVSCSQ
jgi:hypothetical protein